jgi:hypothetical protein
MIIEGICAFLIVILGALDIKSGITEKGVIEICGAVVWFVLIFMRIFYT